MNWSITKEEFALVVRIAERASVEHKLDYRRALMDVTACHANGCPLDLAELLIAEPLDFAHDVWGIRWHINRDTGQLEHCFIPRYAAHHRVKPA
jgi:hypothetical protein